MFRIPARFSRPVIIGTLAVSLTAAAAVAGTIHTFAVSQTTGSEGAYDFLQTTDPGGALQGEVGSAASTGLGTPFGLFGKYGPPSGATLKGIGAVGISTVGWGVVGENLGGGPALYAFPNSKDGVGLDAESDTGDAIYAVAHGNSPFISGAEIQSDGSGTAVDAYSVNGTAILAEGGGGDGIDAYTEGPTNGVYGSSVGGFGVQGFSSSSDGVHAEINNTGSGVAGLNDGSGSGVYASSNTGNGVRAFSVATPSPAPTGPLYEYAATFSQSASGAGIYGVNTHDKGAVGDGSAYRRYTGVFGYASDGAGVYGYSTSDFGMIAENGNADNSTLLVLHDEGADGDEILAGSEGVAGAANFEVSAMGNEYVAGSVSSNLGTFAITRNPHADTVTYGAEATEPMVEDVGSAHLIDGAASVALAADFRQTIQDAAHYMVFLTPYGDAGLYVASRTPAGFVVRETHGGRSTLDFDYRIVAQRYGIQTGRLPHLAALSPRMAQLRLAALHPNTRPAYANTPLEFATVAQRVKEGSRRAALLAQARYASAAARRRMMKPPAPPPNFLAGIRN